MPQLESVRISKILALYERNYCSPTISDSGRSRSHNLHLFALSAARSGEKMPFLLAYSGERPEKSRSEKIPSLDAASFDIGCSGVSQGYL